MTSGQWRVLAILLAILGVQVVSSKTTQGFFTDIYQGKNPLTDVAGVGSAAVGYGLGAIALLALAAFNDGIATGIAVLFLVIVLINRGDTLGPLMQNATNTLMGLAGKNAQSGTTGK